MRTLVLLPLAAVATVVALTPCEKLSGLRLPETTITAAQQVAPESFRNPQPPRRRR